MLTFLFRVLVVLVASAICFPIGALLFIIYVYDGIYTLTEKDKEKARQAKAAEEEKHNEVC